jgi:hypothetical protein
MRPMISMSEGECWNARGSRRRESLQAKPLEERTWWMDGEVSFALAGDELENVKACCAASEG